MACRMDAVAANDFACSSARVRSWAVEIPAWNRACAVAARSHARWSSPFAEGGGAMSNPLKVRDGSMPESSGPWFCDGAGWAVAMTAEAARPPVAITTKPTANDRFFNRLPPRSSCVSM